MNNTQVEIINIGDELLIGQVINTNASWMGNLLSQNGFEVKRISSIADTKDAIHRSLELAKNDVDVVLMSGGLGPTKDDITKKVLAEYFESDFCFNEEAYQHIESLFASRGFKISEVNRNQANIPSKAKAIPNSNGTAYGMWFEENGLVVVSMPGVPFEMKTMMEKEIIPRLIAKYKPDNYFHKTIMTTGVGESMLAEMIEEEETQLHEHIKLAYLPRPGIVRLRLSARGKEAQEVQEKVAKQVRKIEDKLGPEIVFGYDDQPLEEAVAQILVQQNLTVSTAESCTGGTIAQMLTSIAGSSHYFLGGLVSYSNEAKIELLGVDRENIKKHGAVSEEVVRQMAEGSREKFHSDYAMATSGIAGPDGGMPEKPVGYTWIAVAGPEKTIAMNFQFGEHRGRNITRSALTALNMLRRMIK